jgi:hypothetical protein
VFKVLSKRINGVICNMVIVSLLDSKDRVRRKEYRQYARYGYKHTHIWCFVFKQRNIPWQSNIL